MDCLITKLKGVVNDDSLNQLGVLHIFQPYKEDADTNSKYLQIITGTNPVTLSSDFGFDEGENPYIVAANSVRGFNVSNNAKGNNVWIQNVYDIKGIQMSGQNFYTQRELDALIHSKTLKKLYVKSMQENMSVDANDLLGLTYIIFSGNSLKITNVRRILQNKNLIIVSLGIQNSKDLSIDDFQDYENLQRLSYVGGDFTKLPKSIRDYDYSVTYEHTGTIEDLVANQRLLGRTTGAIKISWIKSMVGVTFESTELKTWWENKGYTKNDGFISWDSSTITVGETQPESYVSPEKFDSL